MLLRCTFSERDDFWVSSKFKDRTVGRGIGGGRWGERVSGSRRGPRAKAARDVKRGGRPPEHIVTAGPARACKDRKGVGVPGGPPGRVVAEALARTVQSRKGSRVRGAPLRAHRHGGARTRVQRPQRASREAGALQGTPWRRCSLASSKQQRARKPLPCAPVLMPLPPRVGLAVPGRVLPPPILGNTMVVITVYFFRA